MANKPTSKQTQVMGFGNEYSGAGVDEHLGWGTVPPLTPLANFSGTPYLTFDHDPEVTTERDASITAQTFQLGDVEVGRTLDKNFTFNDRITGIDKQLAWMWGWQAKTIAVIVLQVNAYTDGVNGDTFQFETKSYTLLRQYESKTVTGTILYWAVLQAVVPGDAPSTQTGTMTGTGGETDLVFTSSTELYEHLYEMSADGRDFREFTATELAALTPQATADDKRTCMASLAKKMNGYLMRFDNTKCSGFELKYSAQKILEWDAKWIGYDQKLFATTDPEYADVDFSMACAQVHPEYLVTMNQTRIEIGDLTNQYDGSNFTYYGVMEAMIGAEVPLQKQPDSESGLFFSDPVLSGPMVMKFSATITHADGTTFQDYRNNRTKLAARISSIYGAYSQEILIKEFTLNKAGPDNSDVAAEPLETSVNLACDTHVFDTWLKRGASPTNPESQNSPIVMRVVNDNPYNEMTGRDLAGALRA